MEKYDTVRPVALDKHSMMVSNHDSSGIGFEGDLVSKGPGSIDLLGNYLYIVDGLYSNVKRVDLRTGKVLVSRKFTPRSYPPLSDITVASDSVYALCRSDSVYVLTPDLKLVRTIGLPEKFWRNEQFFVRTDNRKVCVYSPIAGQLVTISDGYVTIKSVSRKLNEGLYANRLPAALPNADSSNWYVSLPNRKFLQLDHPLPDLGPNWWAMNTAWDNHRFAYYTLDNRRLTLYVYSF